MTTGSSSLRSEDTSHYIGIDVGTGSARACIIDHKGNIVGLASENIGLWQPQPGYYEQSTTDIWECICKSVQAALQQQGIDSQSIRGIGFDATCSLAVFAHDNDEPVCVTGPDFSSTDKPVRNVILWLDHRPVQETEKINATKHDLLQYVGGVMSVEMEVPKVLWLKNNMPKDVFARCRFYDLADALTHLATGGETSRVCGIARNQGSIPVGVDGSVKGWQESFLTDIGLADLWEDNFKRMGGVDRNGTYKSAGELVGTLSKKAAIEMGLPAGIAVGSGVIDAYAGWIGTVGAEVNLPDESIKHEFSENDVARATTRLAAVAGTSTCHLVMSDKPIFVKGIWGPYPDLLIPNYWLAEGGQSATGELLRHVLETHPAYSEAQAVAKSQDSNLYDYLNTKLEAMAAEAAAPNIAWLGRHFFFYGDLFGNRSPVADAEMRGAVIGLSNDKSIQGLAIEYYGAMEFIALQTRQIIETMNRAGHMIQSIFMSGSQCQNKELVQLMATSCRMRVVTPRYVHAAVVHGAAMLGVKAASTDTEGKSESLWRIMQRMSKPGMAVYPSRDGPLIKLLQVKYKVFLAQCEQQQRFRREVDEAIAGWTKG